MKWANMDQPTEEEKREDAELRSDLDDLLD